MKYGVIGVDLKSGKEDWCLKNGEPMAFDYSYEADYFASTLNNVTTAPNVRYKTRILPATPDSTKED